MSTTELTELVGLNPGLTVIEASAGTGKTYQITDLVARLVAERGIPMREIVVVTFTKAATAELKDRTRSRLSEALAALDAGGSTRPDLSAFVRRCAEIPEAAQRLRDAQLDFDQALISTIHGFCQRVIDGQGFECGADVGLQLMTDTGPLLEQIVDDWLAERLRVAQLSDYRFLVAEAGFTRSGLLKLAKTATQDPDMPVVPEEGRWTPEAFTGDAKALEDRWSGAEGASVAQGFEAAQSAAEAQLLSLLSTAGAAAGEILAKGPWLAEVFIDQLGWWPALGKPLKSGLHSTNKTHMNAWAGGVIGTTAEGQAAAAAVRSLGFDHTKHILAITGWLAEVTGPEQATEQKAIAALLDAAQEDLPETARTLLDDTAVFMDYRRCLATVERVRFVRWARAELKSRCERRRLRTYHDQIRLLAAPLKDPSSLQARTLVASVGSRIRATLIDEFQDTDALQWQIFRTLLGPWSHPGKDPRAHSEHRLFLIGDPKQAIYSFRGANLHVYLDAVSAAHSGLGTVHTLGTNYRSDEGLIAGLAHMMDGRTGFFGDPRIGFQPVCADRTDRLSPTSPPLQVRFIERDSTAGSKPLTTEEAAAQVAQQVAADVVGVLEEGLQITDESGQQRPLDPGDIAVLVRTHVEARQIQAALKASAVPAINFSTQDVFKSATCGHLLSWLRAVQEPGRSALVRTAATTPLFGMDGVLLAGLDADLPEALKAWELWIDQLRDWRDGFPKRRFLATLRGAMAARRVSERLLSRTDGERRVADLQQLAELTHAAEIEGRLGLSALITWLEQQQLDKAEDPDAVDIRLESESGAVKIQTMHTSKGLQYPIVFVPFAWRTGRMSKPDKDNLIISDAQQPTQRLLDLQLCHLERDKAARLKQAGRDQLEEALRLTYVALTRAQHRCVLYAGHIQALSGGPLAPMLFGDGAQEGEDRLRHAAQRVSAWTRTGATQAEQDAMWEALQDWAQSSPPLSASPAVHSVSARRCPPIESRPRWRGESRAQPSLQTRVWQRHGLDRAWRRHSYSSFVKSAIHTPLTTAEDAGLDLDQDVVEPTQAEPAEAGGGVPLSSFPAGATPGIVLHEVLEKMDFAWARGDSPGSAAAFDTLLDDILGQHGMADQQATLHTGLRQTLRTPLGGPLGELCLADLKRSDRLDELRFDLPLAGGDRHRAETDGPVRGAALIRALRVAPSEGVPPDYLTDLDHREWTDMAGFLNGAIDLVMRATCEDGAERWFVVDYKSNRLAPTSQRAVPVQTYRPERLQEEMAHHDYHLQYHLYTLALHRFLKSRLPGYDYAKDFGGAYYLFVRGMVGPTEGSAQTGVIFARPSLEVVSAMDACVGGRHV